MLCRHVFLVCDAIVAPYSTKSGPGVCDAESPPELTDAQARASARADGWKPGRSRTAKVGAA